MTQSLLTLARLAALFGLATSTRSRQDTPILYGCLVWLACAGCCNLSDAGDAPRKPQPGDLYREFALHNGGDLAWRVTDESATERFEQAKKYLPNPRWSLAVDDLDEAISAEVLLDRWGGHRGTVNKRVRFNGGDWIRVPELQGVPDGVRPEMLLFQDNPVVPVPLEDLRAGANSVEADCDESGGFGWGQWGVYSIVLRVYYDRDKKGEQFEVTGRIVSPASGAAIGEDPLIRVDAEATLGVARIDVLASYDGYDEDGDGRFDGWHESRFQLSRGAPNDLRDHVGTLWRRPYELTWDTHWVPDQAPRAVSLIARVQDSRGYWSVTEPVTGLTLQREGVTVKLYHATGLTEEFGVRVGETKQCYFHIPAGDPLTRRTTAALHLRTWHGWDGHHEPLRVNDHAMPIDGKDHCYDYDLLTFPASALRHGENTFTIHSETEHHTLEVLWPGPAIVTRTLLK